MSAPRSTRRRAMWAKSTPLTASRGDHNTMRNRPTIWAILLFGCLLNTCFENPSTTDDCVLTMCIALLATVACAEHTKRKMCRTISPRR